MPRKNKQGRKENHIIGISVAILVMLSLALFCCHTFCTVQAKDPYMPKITFVGEYSIDGGDFKPIEADKHIPANKGDVTLKGYFRIDDFETDDPERRMLDGTAVSFYLNHITLEVYENGELTLVSDSENDYIGVDSCGQQWTGYTPIDNKNNETTIIIHNPHSFGNATAIDNLLDSMYIYTSPFFDKMAQSFGEMDRGIAVVTITTAVIILGIALFSVLLHTRYSKELAMIGLMGLFGGIYFLFSSDAVYYWNNRVAMNTTAKGLSGMFYMLFVFMIISVFLEGKAKKASDIALSISFFGGLLSVILPLFGKVYYYDTMIWWALATALSAVILIGCLVFSYKKRGFALNIVRLLSLAVLLSFIADLVGTYLGAWQGGVLSRYVFVIMLAIEMVAVLQIVPKNINAVVKAKELEAEKNALDAQLAESRISTMISQIRPHFIYNTLGSIEQLCELDPKKAGELVHNFAKYLRGNFGELDNPKPILMSQEMEHVKHYISIENVRFPDMTFTFEMKSRDFHLPALTVQPIIENAIKHGLMKLQSGGTINVTSFETDSHYCVCVEDNGAGFDTTILLDERKHIGLRNIRGRLEAMVGGSLEIESVIGQGTKATIKVPKEKKDDSNSSR